MTTPPHEDIGISTNHGGGVPASPALEKLHRERGEQLDAYFARTKLLAVIEAFLRELMTLYATTRTAPANPYPSLLAFMRMAEISADELLQPTPRDLKAFPSPELLFFDGGGDGGKKSEVKALPVDSQIATFKQSSESTTTPAWGPRRLMERVAVAPTTWCHAIEALRHTMAMWIVDGELVDDQYRVQMTTLLTGPELALLGHPQARRFPRHLGIERHVSVHGDQLERAITVFARQLIKFTRELATVPSGATGTHAIIPRTPGLRVAHDKSEPTMWTLERINSNRSAFVAAIRAALVANGIFEAECILCHQEEDANSWQLVACTLRLMFHFRSTAAASSKAGPPQEVSFWTGSELGGDFVCFQAQGALDLAQQHAKSGDQISTKSEPNDNATGDMVNELVDAVHHLTRSNAECSYWLALLLDSFAFRVVVMWKDCQVLIQTSEITLSCRDENTPPVESLTSSYEILRVGLQGLAQDATIGASSSLLRGYADALCELSVRHECTGDEMHGTLCKIQDHLYWIAELAAGDFVRLVETSCTKTSTWTTLADLRHDVAASIESRSYPSAVVAEVVFARYLIDANIDRSLESAVVNTVAVSLPPNPFVGMSKYLRVFSCRQSRKRTALCHGNDVVAVAEIEVWSTSFDGLPDPVISCSPHLLSNTCPVWFLAAHTVLTSHRVYRQSEYHPFKASYSARIFPCIVVLHPLEWSWANVDTGTRCLQEINLVECVNIEGSEQGQALVFFADAVWRDVQRLKDISSSVNTAMDAAQITIQLLDPLGQLISIVQLDQIATFEQLIREATPKCCCLQVVWIWSGDVKMPVRVIRKMYVFQFHSTHPPETHMDSDKTIFIESLTAFQLSQCGIVFTLDAARHLLCPSMRRIRAATQVADPERHLWTSYAKEALERDDQLQIMQLDLILPDRLKLRRIQRSLMLLSLEPILLRLLDAERGLHWMQQELNHSQDRSPPCFDQPRMIDEMLRRVENLLQQMLVPMLTAMGHANTHCLQRVLVSLRSGIARVTQPQNDASTIALRMMELETLSRSLRCLQVLVTRSRVQHQRDVFAELSDSRCNLG